jgi:dTDP-4-dehydrorhamnose reductase
MKKIVVIGSNGLLGQTLVQKISKRPDFQLYAMASGENRETSVTDLRYFSIDLTDLKFIKMQLNLIEPDFVINALAMTNVDSCELQQADCKRINTDFVAELAEVCRELKAHLIHISTDFIFDGKEGFYSEEDEALPVNYYGWSKLWAEEAVINSGVVYSILRTIVVYGKVAGMKKNNIVLWIKESLEKGQSINLVDDQFRMPTYVGSLADACILSIEKETVGIYHICGKDLMSIYDMGLEIASYFGLDASLIKTVPTSSLTQPAKRPPKTGFILDKAIDKMGFQPMSLKEGLAEMMQNF